MGGMPIVGKMRVLLVAWLPLALSCEEPPQAELDDGASAETPVACARTFVRRSTHPAARLQLLPEALSFSLGETVDLRADTPLGALDCRLELGATSFPR
jgi:hypothetical protein